MNLESIDRIEHSTYTPLEKKYLKVQFVKVALVYLSLMAVSLFLLCADGFAYRYAATTPSIHDAFPPLCMQFCAYWHYSLFYAEMQDLSRCAGAISAGLEILDKAFADSAEKSV